MQQQRNAAKRWNLEVTAPPLTTAPTISAARPRTTDFCSCKPHYLRLSRAVTLLLDCLQVLCSFRTRVATQRGRPFPRLPASSELPPCSVSPLTLLLSHHHIDDAALQPRFSSPRAIPRAKRPPSLPEYAALPPHPPDNRDERLDPSCASGAGRQPLPRHWWVLCVFTRDAL